MPLIENSIECALEFDIQHNCQGVDKINLINRQGTLPQYQNLDYGILLSDTVIVKLNSNHLQIVKQH